eukprot:scaffold3418_cov124-Isochrysis_galbana.AAC.28
MEHCLLERTSTLEAKVQSLRVIEEEKIAVEQSNAELYRQLEVQPATVSPLRLTDHLVPCGIAHMHCNCGILRALQKGVGDPSVFSIRHRSS